MVVFVFPVMRFIVSRVDFISFRFVVLPFLLVSFLNPVHHPNKEPHEHDQRNEEHNLAVVDEGVTIVVQHFPSLAPLIQNVVVNLEGTHFLYKR